MPNQDDLKFEITLVYRGKDMQPMQYIARGNTLLEAAVKHTYHVAQLAEFIKQVELDNERMKHAPDDDIPF